ncbi:MAG: hypothetical protein R3B57_13410 [Phycisphaerales bacterium]
MMRLLGTPILALAAALLATGCATPTPIDASGAPEDFSIDALVVIPDGAEPTPDTPRSRRPGRYQLSPDGSLRVALGSGVGTDTIPALARRLTREERGDLWRLTRAAGLIDDDPPGRIAWGETWDAPPIGASAILSITHDGRRVHVGAPLELSGGSPGVEALIDRLAALAWEPSSAWASAPTGD